MKVRSSKLETKKRFVSDKSRRPTADDLARTRTKSLKKKQRILDAAAKVLADQGYAEAKLSEIARDAGTQAGSIYYYFPSRDDLVKAVLLTWLERLSSQFTAALEGENAKLPPLNRLRAFVQEVFVHRTSAKDDYLRAYMRNFNQVPESMRKDLAINRRRVRHTLNGLVSEAQAAGQITANLDTGLVALFIVGATNWIGTWYEQSGARSAEEIADTFMDLLMHGLLGAETRAG